MLSIWAYNYDWGGTPAPVTPKGGMPFDRKNEYKRAKQKADLFKQFTEVSSEEVKAKQDLSRLITVNIQSINEPDLYSRMIEQEQAVKRLREAQKARNNRIALMLLDD